MNAFLGTTFVLSLLTHATYAVLLSSETQLKEEILEYRNHLASKSVEEISEIVADNGSIDEFLDELYGLTWKSQQGIPTNSSTTKKTRSLPLYFDNTNDVDPNERRVTTSDTIKKKKMKEFTVFSNAQALTLNKDNLDPTDGSGTGNIFVQPGMLFDKDGYITGESDLACTLLFEDSNNDNYIDELFCNAVFTFSNKYGFEVGQLHMQGIIRGLTVLDVADNNNAVTITNSMDIFAVIGGTGCFAGAKGLATFEGLPYGSLWYTKKHDIHLYEYWNHEYSNPADTYPF